MRMNDKNIKSQSGESQTKLPMRSPGPKQFEAVGKTHAARIVTCLAPQGSDPTVIRNGTSGEPTSLLPPKRVKIAQQLAAEGMLPLPHVQKGCGPGCGESAGVERHARWDDDLPNPTS